MPYRPYLLFALAAVFFPIQAHGANLLVNPLFEDKLQGWEELWCQEAGQGKTQWLATPNPGGPQCLKVTYLGANDWTLGQAQRISVKPGEIYAFSGWVKTENLPLPGEGQLSFVARDASGGILNWTFGMKAVWGDHDWRKLSGCVTVPENCDTLQFRISGDHPGTTYWSGLSVEKAGEILTPASLKPVTISAAGTSLEYQPGPNLLVLIHPDGSQQRFQGWGSGGNLTRLGKGSENRLDLVLADSTGNTAAASAQVGEDGSLLFTLKGDGPLDADFEFPGAILSAPGDHWVVPMNEGLYVPCDDAYFKPTDLLLHGGHGLSMPFLGLTSGKAGIIAIAETQNDASSHFTPPLPGGTSSWSFFWQPSTLAWGYERRLRVVPTTDGYVGIAKAYRAYARAQGLVVTLKEKAKANPWVDKLVGAVDLWWWQDGSQWSEDPAPEDVAREMKAAGIERVLWSHEQEPQVVTDLAGLGFLTGKYDLYQDVYSPDTPISWVNKEGWPECLDLLPGGEWMQGWVSRLNGVNYPGGVLCSSCILGMAQRHIPPDLATHAYHARFLDTITAAALRECYDPKHPHNRTQDRENKMALLDYVSKDMKMVTGSETGVDMAVPHLEYFEGMMSLAPYRLPDSGYELFSYIKPQEDLLRFQVGPYYRIPLFELVYHDCVVNYWYWGDSSNRLPECWDNRDLYNALYGNPPLWAMDRALWAKDKDRFIQSYVTGTTVARQTGYSEMLRHDFVTPDHEVQTTLFADGTKVWVNFGEKAYTLPDGTVLKDKGWKVVKGEKSN